MKTQTMKPAGVHPRKTNDRWKWMLPAVAAATSAPHAPGATAQISLINDFLDAHSSPQNQLSFDISPGGNPFASNLSYRANIFNNTHLLLRADFAGVGDTIVANHQYFNSKNNVGFYGGVTGLYDAAGSVAHYRLIPIILTDPNIQGGNTVDGLLEVEASVTNTPDATISLLDVFYPTSGTSVAALTVSQTNGSVSGDTITDFGSSDDGVYTAASVPEPSSLGLLAMGAAGVLAYRRRRKAA
jgi:hypothetical protein